MYFLQITHRCKNTQTYTWMNISLLVRQLIVSLGISKKKKKKKKTHTKKKQRKKQILSFVSRMTSQIFEIRKKRALIYT